MSHTDGSSVPTKQAESGASNPNEDWIVQTPPMDSIQAMEWSPTSDTLASVSWDCAVRTYRIDPLSGSSTAVAELKCDTPPLDVSWSSNGNTLGSAGCDKVVKIWNLTRCTPSVVGGHDEPVRRVAFCGDGSVSEQIVSGGWDKELRFWDPKQSVSFSSHCSRSPHKKQLKPISSVSCSERVYAMALSFPLLTVCLANKKVLIFDVRNPSKPIREMVTLLKHQLRCISIAPGQRSFAVGSVEGRCAVHPLFENQDQKPFAFKCHRHGDNISGVNAVRFYSGSTLASAGGDGIIYFWDKDKKQKLRTFKSMDLPVTDVAFNADGSLMAYSTSYDWSGGVERFQPQTQNPRIFIHQIDPNEVRANAKLDKTAGSIKSDVAGKENERKRDGVKDEAEPATTRKIGNGVSQKIKKRPKAD